MQCAAAAHEVKDNTRVILSYHDYKKTPSLAFLEGLIDEMWAEKADIVKVAVTANDITDCFRVIHLLKNSKGLFQILWVLPCC